ncbi:bifunctional riboflavin kinase/FAD synthetase [bacterium]|nr:bifunctional riboflavin kinase/FAD synthetase [candidate division CSSED10-310 bacterium]
MRIIQSFSDLPNDLTKVVMTMGNFDGVHIGHQNLIGNVVLRAERVKGVSVVLTYQPHPVSVLYPRKQLKRITGISEMMEIIGSFGVDFMVSFSFTPELARLDPDEFLKTVIFAYTIPESIVIGADHRFGKDRRGDARLLSDLGSRMGIDVSIVEDVVVGGEPVSSTRIRELVASGDLETARLLLGRFFRLTGIVRKGFGRGHDMGFPTANFTVSDRVLPPPGVYAGQAGIRGQSGPSVTYIGDSPTFDEGSYQVETHLFGFQGDLYGQLLEVDLMQRIRPDTRFKTPSELVEQMKRDARDAMEIYRKHF